MIINSEVGLRFGDETHWGSTGSLNVTNSISVVNNLYNVWNFVESVGESFPGAIRISYSMVDIAEYDTLLGCQEGVRKVR